MADPDRNTEPDRSQSGGADPARTAAEDSVELPEEDAQAASEQATGGTEDPYALLEDARSKADQHWDQCLRLQADVENLRKRAQRDLEHAHKYALEKFAGELLPVKDSLEMGIAAAVAGEDIDPEKLKEGKELTLKMLAAVMEKFGIVEINPEGERFNPEYHEAISIQERTDMEANTVVTVVQKGYLLNDRLIRPAMVIVSRAAESPNVDERA